MLTVQHLLNRHEIFMEYTAVEIVTCGPMDQAAFQGSIAPGRCR